LFYRKIKKEELKVAMLEEEERFQAEEMELDEEYSPSPQPAPVLPKSNNDTEPELPPSTPVIEQAQEAEEQAEQPQQEAQQATEAAPPAINFTPIAPATEASAIPTPRPAVTSNTSKENDPETTLKRRENHRLVERRRRETINKGINELAELIPDCGKKRSTVILKATEHISELKRVNEQICQERDLLKEQNQLLVKELADKNRKINELLLML
jgi:hypothetical protein